MAKYFRKTCEEKTRLFVEKAIKKYGDKYDYSKVFISDSKHKIVIIDPETGNEFNLNRYSFLKYGIPHTLYPLDKNEKNKRIKIDKTKKYIEKAIVKFGKDAYDFSKTEIKNSKEKIIVIDKQTGKEHKVNQYDFLKYGLKKRDYKYWDTEMFIKEAKKIYNDKYDYSKLKYIKASEKVVIICPEHGEFKRTPYEHLSGYGCRECMGLSKFNKHTMWNTESFIKEATKIHKGIYSYENTKYIDFRHKIKYNCPVHGEIEQYPQSHIKGYGCHRCNKYSNRYSVDEWIEKVKILHGNKYDYSKTYFNTTEDIVTIICPEHGEFLIPATAHMHGLQGCPLCSDNKSKMEKDIEGFLIENNFNFITQHKCEWLRFHNPLSLDFYLPDHKIAIECQGEQHFHPVDYFGGENEFKQLIVRDHEKIKLCKENGISLIHYADDSVIIPDGWNEYKIVRNKEDLINLLNNSCKYE